MKDKNETKEEEVIMKRKPITALLLSVVLALSIFGGSYLSAFADADDASESLELLPGEITQEQQQEETEVAVADEEEGAVMQAASAEEFYAPPTIPGRPQAEATEPGEVYLTWEESNCCPDGYYIYRSKTSLGNYVQVGMSDVPEYVDTDLESDTRYYYRIAAFNDVGVSKQTFYTSVRTLASALAAPANVAATALDQKRIRITWEPVSGASRYYVYRSDDENGTYQQIASTISTVYTNTGLTPGVDYYYVVAAYGSAGVGERSDPAHAGTQGGVPSAPTGVLAEGISDKAIRVEWIPVSGATSYSVYRSTTASGSYRYMGDASSASYVDEYLSANTGYYYKVVANNAAGSSPQSVYAYGKTGQLSIPAPSLSASARSISSILLSWTPVSGATHYHVYYSTNASGLYQLVDSVNSAETTYLVNGLKTSTTYYFKVVASVNSALGAESALASATTMAGETPISSFPTSISATALDTSSVKIQWSVVPEAKGYYIYVASYPTGNYDYVGVTNTTSYTHTGLNMNTAYYYKVAAFNDAGTGPQSQWATTTTLFEKLHHPPTWVYANGIDRYRIEVMWSAVTGADGYYIYRSTSSRGNFAYVGSSKTTNYTDFGLKKSRSYYYVVVAYNSEGLSPMSNVVKGKTLH